jgi:hypothetical protein
MELRVGGKWTVADASEFPFVSADRSLGRDDEAKLFGYTARVEVSFCAMVAWLPRTQADVSIVERNVPLTVIQESSLIQVHHQAAGHGCFNMIITGFPVQLTRWGESFARRLVLNYWHYADGHFEDHGTRSRWLLESPVAKKQWSEEQRLHWCEESLERVEGYRRFVEPLSTECLVQPQRVDLCESFYPFDLNDENLLRVASDPEAVNREIKMIAHHFHPLEAVICILAENSD